MGRKIRFEVEAEENNSLVSKKVKFMMADFLQKHTEFITAKKLEGVADRTVKDYTANLRYFKEWLEINGTVIANCACEKSIFMEYTGHMFQKGLKPCTINIRLRTLKCYLNWLRAEEYIKEDIASKIKLVKVPKDTIQPLTPQEVKKILSSINRNEFSQYRDYALMLLMLETGIRVNEACSLIKEDIDIKRLIVRVRAEVAKTREERWLPISKKTLTMLTNLIKDSEKRFEDYVFTSSYGGQLDTLVAINNFRKYGKRAGIEHRATPHIFRHTFAVEMVKSKVDVFTLQKLMGHANISTTRQYIQLDTQHLVDNHKEVNLLNKFL